MPKAGLNAKQRRFGFDKPLDKLEGHSATASFENLFNRVMSGLSEINRLMVSPRYTINSPTLFDLQVTLSL